LLWPVAAKLTLGLPAALRRTPWASGKPRVV
jgi:hypothetical protein